MVVAFSGSPHGMTPRQYAFVSRILWAYQARIAMGVHTDSVGADVEFDWICEQLGILRQARPSEQPRSKTRARCTVEFPTQVEPRPFNLDEILERCEFLIAAPRDTQRTSVDYVLIQRFEEDGKPYLIIFPSGQYFMSLRCLTTGWRFQLAVPFGGPWPDLALIEEPGKERQRFFKKRTVALMAGLGQNTRVSRILGLFEADQAISRPGQSDAGSVFLPDLNRTGAEKIRYE